MTFCSVGVRLSAEQSAVLGKEFKFDPHRVVKHCDKCKTAYCSDSKQNLYRYAKE